MRIKWPILAMFTLSSFLFAQQSVEQLGRAARLGDVGALAQLRSLAEGGDPTAQTNLGEMYDVGWGVQRNATQAVSLYQKGAAKGYCRAQFLLATMYQTGSGVPPNATTASEWSKQAALSCLAPATRSLASAQASLGVLYAEGVGVAKDITQAVAWLSKAAKQGFAPAQTDLGSLYYQGQGIPQDFTQAETWYRKAAEQGYAPGQTYLGSLYYNGQGVSQDFAQAAAWYRKAAEQGQPDAQGNLASLYRDGKGVTRDMGQAVIWYRKAAEQGYAEAERLLGYQYYNGEGAPKDLGQALEWFRKAAVQGDSQAQEYLAILYHKGDGVSQDDQQSRAWLTEAMKNGNTTAQTSLIRMLSPAVKALVSRATRGDKLAIEELRGLAGAGNVVAQYDLGYLLSQGIYRKGSLGDIEILPQDLVNSFEWYRKAANQNYGQTEYSLGYCYEYGVGVSQDDSKAVEWYERAGKMGVADGKNGIERVLNDFASLEEKRLASTLMHYDGVGAASYYSTLQKMNIKSPQDYSRIRNQMIALKYSNKQEGKIEPNEIIQFLNDAAEAKKKGSTAVAVKLQREVAERAKEARRKADQAVQAAREQAAEAAREARITYTSLFGCVDLVMNQGVKDVMAANLIKLAASDNAMGFAVTITSSAYQQYCSAMASPYRNLTALKQQGKLAAEVTKGSLRLRYYLVSTDQATIGVLARSE